MYDLLVVRVVVGTADEGEWIQGCSGELQRP
jgi:hypothetical protein